MSFRSLALAAAMLSSTAFAQAESASAVTNRLGLEIMRQVVLEQKAPRNTMVSPLSAQIALAMALNGTGGQTRAQLLQLLGASSAEALNVSNKNVHRVLSRAKLPKPDDFSPAPPALLINNGAWNTNGATDGTKFIFSDVYKRILVDSYGASPESLDFKQPQAAVRINDWVKTNTLGLIPQITDADTLAQFAWVLINTTYLEATWLENFYKRDAKEPNFSLVDGQKKSVPMIAGEGEFGYVAKPVSNIEVAVEIPFADNGPTKLAMIAVLPADGVDFLSLQRSSAWTMDFWKQIVDGLQASRRERGRVTLPKFSYSDSVELREASPITHKLGLGFLFSRSADFSAMATRDSQPTSVGLIKQNTRIELDEKGVKAAAATMVAGVVRSAPPMTRYEVEFNRPFVYALVDRTTGTLLFVGSVADPSAN